ncbi:MAG: HlyD family efflux transporter periplasmic adaptor subunit [Pontiella sp.]
MKKSKKWIIAIIVIAGGAYWFFGSKSKQMESTKPTYDRAKVEVRDLRTVVESTGEVQPRNRLDVKPPIAGRLEELLVDEGVEVDKGQILGWISSTERATLLDAALATSKDELAYWEELYKPSPLISPLKGTIIARNFEPGQSIGVNDAVVVIADDLIVVANLDETDIGLIKLEQNAEARLEAYPDNEFFCIVEKIAYDASTVQNVTMYEVDIRSDRLPPFARSGMTANLEFVIEERKGVLAVSASAIKQKTAEIKSAGNPPKPKPENAGSGGEDEGRRKMMMERMRERGMSDAEIQERLAQFAAGGGRPRGDPGGERSGGGWKGGAKRDSGGISYVLVPSDDAEVPEERIVKTGLSDGSYIEIIEGLEEGDEVLIQKIRISSSRSSSGSSSPFTPTLGRGGRGSR